MERAETSAELVQEIAQALRHEAEGLIESREKKGRSRGEGHRNGDITGEIEEKTKISPRQPLRPAHLVALIYLCNDLLHNSGSMSGTVRGAGGFRTALETNLASMVLDIGIALRSVQGRITRSAVLSRILRCLQLWETWSLFPKTLCWGLEAAVRWGQEEGEGDMKLKKKKKIQKKEEDDRKKKEEEEEEEAKQAMKAVLALPWRQLLLRCNAAGVSVRGIETEEKEKEKEKEKEHKDRAKDRGRDQEKKEAENKVREEGRKRVAERLLFTESFIGAREDEIASRKQRVMVSLKARARQNEGIGGGRTVGEGEGERGDMWGRVQGKGGVDDRAVATKRKLAGLPSKTVSTRADKKIPNDSYSQKTKLKRRKMRKEAEETDSAWSNVDAEAEQRAAKKERLRKEEALMAATTVTSPASAAVEEEEEGIDGIPFSDEEEGIDGAEWSGDEEEGEDMQQ